MSRINAKERGKDSNPGIRSVNNVTS